MKAFAVVALFTMAAGCVLCPECGCYPDSWSGEWTQPEMAAAIGALEGAARPPPVPGFDFDEVAVGLPAGVQLSGLRWTFGQADGHDRTITVTVNRDSDVVLRYAYPGSQGDESNGPKKGVLAAELDAFMDLAWNGTDEGRTNVAGALLATWDAVDHYEYASGSVKAPMTWKTDQLYASGAWVLHSEAVGRAQAVDGRLSMLLAAPTWAIDDFSEHTYVEADAFGRIAGGHLDSRTLDVDALQDRTRQQFSRLGLPEPVFDDFEAQVQEICVD